MCMYNIYIYTHMIMCGYIWWKSNFWRWWRWWPKWDQCALTKHHKEMLESARVDFFSGEWEYGHSQPGDVCRWPGQKVYKKTMEITMLLMGKFTISTGPLSIAMYTFTRGYMCEIYGNPKRVYSNATWLKFTQSLLLLVSLMWPFFSASSFLMVPL